LTIMKTVIYLCVLVIFTACTAGEKTVNQARLVGLEQLELPIGNEINPRSKALAWYSDSGTDYLVYLNSFHHNIIFFDLGTQKQSFAIELQKEGPDGLGKPAGFFVKSLDSVFVTSRGRKTLYLVNRKGIIIDRFNYEKTEEGYITEATYYSRSIGNTQLIIRENNLYLTNTPGGLLASLPDNYLAAVPLALHINLLDRKVNALAAGAFPKDLWPKESSKSLWFSRVFNGEYFVYLWWHVDSLYFTKDHATFYSKPIKSNFFDKIKPRPRQLNGIVALERFNCENPKFDNIVYDKFRDVFYILAYIGVETDSQTDIIKLTRNKYAYTILIYNRHFAKIGEQRLPDKRYLPSNYFVGRAGLYISENNELNDGFDEDYLRFTLFKLFLDE